MNAVDVSVFVAIYYFPPFINTKLNISENCINGYEKFWVPDRVFTLWREV